MNAIDLLRSEGLPAVWPGEVFGRNDFYDPKPLFAAACKRYGKTLRTNAAGEEFSAELFLSLQQEINAYAAKLGSRHYVGITYKQLLFSRVMAESALFWKTVFFDIKTPFDAEAEKERLLKMRDQAQRIASFKGGLMARFDEAYASEDMRPLLDLYETHDLKRRRAAWYIAQSSVLLALRHELVHVVNGHCGWAHAVDASRRLCIFNEVSPFHAGLDVESLRSLELEADFYAAAFCLFDILQGTDPLDVVLHTDFDVATRIGLLTFAMCSLALVWQSETRKGLEDAAHPPPLTRAYTFLNGLYAAADSVQVIDATEIVARGVKKGLESIFVYSHVNSDYAELGRVVDEVLSLQEYRSIVNRRLDGLEPYAYRDRS